MSGAYAFRCEVRTPISVDASGSGQARRRGRSLAIRPGNQRVSTKRDFVVVAVGSSESGTIAISHRYRVDAGATSQLHILRNRDLRFLVTASDSLAEKGP